MNVNEYNSYIYQLIDDNHGFILSSELIFGSAGYVAGLGSIFTDNQLSYWNIYQRNFYRMLFVDTIWSYTIIPISSNIKYIFTTNLKYILLPITDLFGIMAIKLQIPNDPLHTKYSIGLANSIIYGAITKKIFNLFEILVKNYTPLSISNSHIFNRLFHHSYNSLPVSMTLGILLAKYDDNSSVKFQLLNLVHYPYSAYNSILGPIQVKNYIYENRELLIASPILIYFVIKIQNHKKYVSSNYINS